MSAARAGGMPRRARVIALAGLLLALGPALAGIATGLRQLGTAEAIWILVALALVVLDRPRAPVVMLVGAVTLIAVGVWQFDTGLARGDVEATEAWMARVDATGAALRPYVAAAAVMAVAAIAAMLATWRARRADAPVPPAWVERDR